MVMSSAPRIDRVIRVCAGHHDARSLRLELLEAIRSVVGFDAYAWLLTDPETEVGAAPLADVPVLPDLPRLIGLKYATTVNRWTQLEAPVGLLRAATGGRRERSLVWRELLAGYDVGDVASLVFRDRFGCWAFLDLWRLGSRAEFTAPEAAFLLAAAEPITEALRRAQATSFSLGESTVDDAAGPVVLMLSSELGVKAQTPETEHYLRQLVPPDGDRQPVPAGAYNVAAQLMAVEAGIDDHAPSARVHLSGGTWLTMRAARLAHGPSGNEPDIAVTIEPTAPAARTALFVRAFGLTAREAELVTHLAGGADTRELAQRMFLSPNTVQDHLKSIFAKTGSRNRRTLLARALGR